MSLPLNADNATQAWDDLAARLDRFLAQWEGGAEPLLADFLPDAQPADGMTVPHVHRRMVLIELVKIDLEQRTGRGQPKPLESYTSEYPELLENGEPPCELIYEEYHVRRGAGMTVTPQHYFERFPRSAAALKRLMGTEGFSQTTQLGGAAKRVKGLAPGQNIDDFDLLVELGKGAFGSVFLARQISMGRLVALKVSADKGNEPRTLGQFDHPNIIRVFDQRRLADKGVLLCYMTYAPGGTLQDVVRKVRGTPAAARTGAQLIEAVDEAMQRAGQFTGEETPWRKRLRAAPWPETVCKLGVQLAQALDYAHKKGVLHRDVKPANVLISAECTPKLADFNISFNAQIEGATPAAYFGGSLAYMSPEQLEACNPSHERKPEDLDGRSDLYSLAVVLWELLHGDRPFADDELSGAWSVMLADMAVRRRERQPQAPVLSSDPIASRLERVLLQAMSPDPPERFPDGAAMARELLLCLNPRAWDLTHNMATGWRDLARREPMAPLTLVVLPPFVLAGWFNLWYNQTYFLPWLRDEIDPAMEQAFWRMVPAVNLTLYPLGVALAWWYVAPMTRSLRRLARGEPVPQDELRRSRARAMNVGHGVAWIGVALWLVAGIAFPTGISLQAGFHGHPFIHFILAMFVSGLISCCLPFLSATWLSVRVFIPALLANTAPEPDEQKQLARLSWFSGIYFMVAPAAPLLAILLLILSGVFKNVRQSHEPDPVVVLLWLIATSIACLGLAYHLWQRIRTDLATLTIATRSAELSSTHTDTVETF
jgi:serine/threonine protein kinase